MASGTYWLRSFIMDGQKIPTSTCTAVKEPLYHGSSLADMQQLRTHSSFLMWLAHIPRKPDSSQFSHRRLPVPDYMYLILTSQTDSQWLL